MPTLQLNPQSKPIVLDTQSQTWLQVIQHSDKRPRNCMVPERYFKILQTWGLVEGTFANAKLSASGRARLLIEAQQVAAEEKKATRKH